MFGESIPVVFNVQSSLSLILGYLGGCRFWIMKTASTLLKNAAFLSNIFSKHNKDKLFEGYFLYPAMKKGKQEEEKMCSFLFRHIWFSSCFTVIWTTVQIDCMSWCCLGLITHVKSGQSGDAMLNDYRVFRPGL